MFANFMKNQYDIHYSRREYREEYLKTEEWREKSRYILERDPICRACDKHKSSDAHHLTYENLPFEDLNKDIIGVCRACHNKIHSWEVTARCKDIRRLKRLLDLMGRKIKINEVLVCKMNSLNINAKKYLSGLFKKNLYYFDEFIGLRLPFRKYLQIKNFIKRFENKPLPRIPSREKHLRTTANKRRGLDGKGGWSRKIL